LQQVGANAFATAIAIDPAKLPALIAVPRRRNFLNLGRLWLLHGRLLKRAILALACCAAAGSLYVLRDRIATEAGVLYVLGETQLAQHSPLSIAKISMSGQGLTSDHDILAALALTPQTSMLNFDPDAARTAVEQLPAVAEATVRKVYPNHLYVSVTERVPVARWRVDGTTYVIDGTGAKIADDGNDYPALPLVVGDSAGDDAMVMIRAMDQYPALKQGLVALSRIADRRWDMIYDSGLRIQLPEQGVAQALGQLTTLQNKFQLLQRDVVAVDLRVPGVVAIKPSDDAAKQLAEISKANIAKNKGNFKQDSDYSAPAGR